MKCDRCHEDKKTFHLNLGIFGYWDLCKPCHKELSELLGDPIPKQNKEYYPDKNKDYKN